MMMKEAARPDKDGGENLISNLASGLCFDFSNLDPTIYPKIAIVYSIGS